MTDGITTNNTYNSIFSEELDGEMNTRNYNKFIKSHTPFEIIDHLDAFKLLIPNMRAIISIDKSYHAIGLATSAFSPSGIVITYKDRVETIFCSRRIGQQIIDNIIELIKNDNTNNRSVF